MSALLLDALKCANERRPPVWLMRQAGRYMPEYQVLRKKHSLWQLFHEPELASQVTHLPIDLLGIDAAIVFSDILVIAEVLGLSIVFPETGGPRVEPSIRTSAQADALPILPVDEVLSYVFETIRQVKKEITIPLIGFCGAPFTIASYLIDSGSKQEFIYTKQWMKEDPKSFHRLLDKLTESSIAYLLGQIKAGVDVIQVFDSWASVLSDEERRLFCYPYLQKIVDALKPTGIPVILFCRNSSLFPQELSALESACISFDWHRPMSVLRAQVPSHIAIQGNIDPSFLKNEPDQIVKAVKELLVSMRGEKGFIVNLGHGVLPDIPFKHVQCFVDTVKSFGGITT